MTKRHKKAWGPGNALWEWKQKHSKASHHTHTRRARRGASHMARKKYRHKSSGILSGQGMLHGTLGKVALGFGVAVLAQRFLGLNGLLKYGVSFAAAGPMGAVGALAGDYIGGASTSGSSGVVLN